VSGPLFRSAELRSILGLPDAEADHAYASVSTDSRSAEADSLFVALRGPRFDGMDFLSDAAAAGAIGAVVPEDRPLPDVDLGWFPVPDPLIALGALAAAHRSKSEARVVGVTGTSGKTTVKEMIAAALTDSRVHRTEGNLNNQIGLPLSILRAPSDADVWVLELGSSEPGEIARLTDIARPDDAVVTTVGQAHLEGFGDVAGVLDEKLALVIGACASGSVVVGERPPELGEAARHARPDTVVAGLGPACDYRPQRCESDADHVSFTRAGVTVRVEAGGLHHLRDALIAAAVAEALGTPPDRIAAGLARFRPLALRSVVRQAGKLTVVADCYNANPESFGAAIEFCTQAFPGRRLAAVVGTMLELGERSAPAHRDVARALLDAGFELVVATGEFGGAFDAVASFANGRIVLGVEGVAEASEVLAEHLQGDEVVLVKASRGVRLESVVERLVTSFGASGP